MRVAVAASGGRDSTALLHLTARLAAAHGLQVHALHVHHGLLPEADHWQAQVQSQCRRWARTGLPLSWHTTRLTSRPAPGESVEAWARRERYKALADMARAAGCTLVLLAHHRRDQAETLLLQALRGGGPAGLASMPRRAERAGLVWARPWLDLPREAIEAYVRRHRLSFVDDASNADPRFARNRLRLQVWPALTAAFPDAEASLAVAAQRAQESAQALNELAAMDLAQVVQGSALIQAPWLALSAARRSLCLRAWLTQALAAPVPGSLVQRLCAELPQARAASWPAPGGQLQLYRGRLMLQAAVATPAPNPGPITLDLSRPGRHALEGWGGEFIVQATRQGGALPSTLAHVVAVPRQGGERFMLQPGSPARSLKKQFQALAQPAAQRGGPLLMTPEGLLVFVPGLGFDARALAPAGEAALDVRWMAHARNGCA